MRNRTAMLKGFLAGTFSLKETLILALPTRISPSRNTLMPKYTEFLREKSEEEIFLFLEKKYPGVFKDTLGKDLLPLIYEIVVMDQYKAKSFLTPDSVVIDAGANIGIFSLFAALIAKEGKVFSFEPVKNIYEILKRNTEKFPRIKVFNQGLGEKEKIQKILTSSGSHGINALTDSELATKNKKYFDGAEDVKITTIDSVIKREKISRVDFIKIDTEGYEAQILEGAHETIKKWKPVIAMSAYHGKDDKKNLPRILKNICKEYVCELHKDAEEDLVCHVKNKCLDS